MLSHKVDITNIASLIPFSICNYSSFSAYCKNFKESTKNDLYSVYFYLILARSIYNKQLAYGFLLAWFIISVSN